MKQQWIKGIPEKVERDRVYAILEQRDNGLSVGCIVRGEDCNWKSTSIIGHYPLPIAMNSAEARRIQRSGEYSWPAPATFIQAKGSYAERMMEQIELTPDNTLVPELEDEYYAQAVEIVREIPPQTEFAPTAKIQRRLRIGYNRAARLIEAMEARGIITAPNERGFRMLIDEPQA